jgi:hypothetical protein
MSGPDPLLITFEILLTIVTPLLALDLRGQWPLRTVTACMCGIAVVWYLTYAPIHELSHALGTVSLALCLLSVVAILRRYGGFPETGDQLDVHDLAADKDMPEVGLGPAHEADGLADKVESGPH